MNTVHNLKARGAAFSLPNLTRVEEGTGGTGVALCSCGWYSIPQSSGRMRKTAHALHKAEVEAAEKAADEEVAERLSQPLLPETDPVVDKLIAGGRVEIKDGEQVAAEDEEVEMISEPKIVELTDEQATSQLAAYASIDGVQLEVGDRIEVDFAAETYDWRGNYSIVFAPGTVELADAVGGIEVDVKNFSAVHRVVTFSGSRTDVDRFAALLPELEADALKHLHEWQKAHRATRKGLTDMQKFNEHRAVLRQFIASRADELRS